MQIVPVREHRQSSITGTGDVTAAGFVGDAVAEAPAMPLSGRP
ncbi:hypothetical protein [Bradyrhizobium sp. YR681]|nr:hypothetical protein [Bradyrhizobium sp. YR681]